MALVRAVRLINNITGGNYTSSTLNSALGNAVTLSDFEQAINVRSQSRNLAYSISGVTVAAGSTIAANEIVASPIAFSEIFANTAALSAFSSQTAGRNAVIANPTATETVKSSFTRDLSFISGLSGSSLVNWVNGQTWRIAPGNSTASTADPFTNNARYVYDYASTLPYSQLAFWGGNTYVKTSWDAASSYSQTVAWTTNNGASWNYNAIIPANSSGRAVLSFANGYWFATIERGFGGLSSFYIGTTPGNMVQAFNIGVPLMSVGSPSGRVAYGAGRWVLVGNSGKYQHSTDTITWTEGNIPTNVIDVQFTNNLFFAFSDTGNVHTSSDGLTWTTRSTTSLGTMYGFFYENGRYFVTGSSGIMTSTDAVTWTFYGGNAQQFRAIRWFNGRYWAVGTPYFATSTDGITWTRPATIAGTTNNTSLNAHSLEVASGVLFAQVNGGATLSTVDGTNWSILCSVGGFGLSQRGSADTLRIQSTQVTSSLR